MTISEARKEYNKSLERFNKAEQFFDRKDKTQKEKESFLPMFTGVLNDLNYYLSKSGQYTTKELLEGFNG